MSTSSNWVYIRSEPGLYTVGFYSPDGTWEPESDWDSTNDAAARVHYLNGGEAHTFADHFRACRNNQARRDVEGGAK